MKSALCLFLLASAVAPTVNATTIDYVTTVNVLVTDRHGKPLPSASVVVNGVSEREGRTNNAGRVVFPNMKAGSYLLRVERDKFIAFEKEFAVLVQSRSTHVVAAISPVASLAARPSRARASARTVVPAAARRD